jgi:hypothetical protein
MGYNVVMRRGIIVARHVGQIVAGLNAAISSPADRTARLDECKKHWGKAFAMRSCLDEDSTRCLHLLLTAIGYPTLEKSTYAIKAVRFCAKELLAHIEGKRTGASGVGASLDLEAVLEHLEDSGIDPGYPICGPRPLPEYDNGFTAEDALAVFRQLEGEFGAWAEQRRRKG